LHGCFRRGAKPLARSSWTKKPIVTVTLLFPTFESRPLLGGATVLQPRAFVGIGASDDSPAQARDRVVGVEDRAGVGVGIVSAHALRGDRLGWDLGFIVNAPCDYR
jgi:hypothetical protein